MGRNIYFTDKELQQIRNYVFEAVDILGEASETYEQVNKDMEDGLGSALRKLYKGCNGESKYLKYKTKRGWKIVFIGGNMSKGEMTTNEVVNLLMNKGNEIDNKIINTISELLRLEYDSERGKDCVKNLRSSIEYSLDEIERILNR